MLKLYRLPITNPANTGPKDYQIRNFRIIDVLFRLYTYICMHIVFGIGQTTPRLCYVVLVLLLNNAQPPTFNQRKHLISFKLA